MVRILYIKLKKQNIHTKNLQVLESRIPVSMTIGPKLFWHIQNGHMRNPGSCLPNLITDYCSIKSVSLIAPYFHNLNGLDYKLAFTYLPKVLLFWLTHIGILSDCGSTFSLCLQIFQVKASCVYPRRVDIPLWGSFPPKLTRPIRVSHASIHT